MPNRCMPTPRTATSFIDILRSRSRLDHRTEADDHNVLAVLLAQRLELRLDCLADAVVLLPPGERQLDARPLGQVDLADAVADVLEPRRAEEGEVDEGVAVERAARAEEDVGHALAQALRAHGAPGEEVLPAVLAARAEEPRRLGRVVGHREVARLDRDARPRRAGHSASRARTWARGRRP